MRNTQDALLSPAVSVPDAVAAARADGYELRGSTGAVSLSRDGSHVGTYRTHRGALMALVDHASGRVAPERRSPQPRARHD